MAANLKLKELNVSLAFSSCSSTVETEKTDQEYTEDFHSNLQSSIEEISSKLSEISADYSVVDIDEVVNHDECMSQFVGKKLQVLKENQVKKIRKSTDRTSRESHKELSQFWLGKLEILRQRNTSNTSKCNENKEKINNISKPNDKSASKFIKTNPTVNEIGCFQSAYERLKFENLREKCRGLLNTDIHSLETCQKCQEMQDELLKDEFYTSCVRKVNKNAAEEKLSEHMQSSSSALLIANIIKDGPKPSWRSDEIWDKLLSGGYQHGKSMNQN